MKILGESSRSRTVHLLDVISHFVLNCLLVLGFVSTNPVAAMLQQKGRTLRVPPGGGQLSRAVTRTVQGVYLCATQGEELNGPQVTNDCGSMESGSPFRVVRRLNAYAVRQHSLDRAEVSVIRSVYQQ